MRADKSQRDDTNNGDNMALRAWAQTGMALPTAKGYHARGLPDPPTPSGGQRRHPPAAPIPMAPWAKGWGRQTHEATAHDAVEAFQGLEVLVGEVELYHP